jgi:YD repeat-containing protein
MTYGYDALDRLSTVTDANGATSYTYDPVGNLGTVTYPNGVAHSYTYDTRNRLMNLGVTGAVSGAPGPIASYGYTLDAAGHRTSVTELSGRKVNYTYDTIYRLTNETIASDPNAMNGAVSYGYDAVGNRLQKTSTLPGFPGGSSTYNANDGWVCISAHLAMGTLNRSSGKRKRCNLCFPHSERAEQSSTRLQSKAKRL